MRTAAAYISKLKTEALGRTYKVQDTNHRLFTTTLYRGAAGCGPVDYTQLDYVPVCECKYLGPASRNIIPFRPSVYDGGTVINSGLVILDGGSPINGGEQIIDGGKP